MGRQMYREGNEADREAGTLWDSEWVYPRRARLLLAGSAELCDWIQAPSLPFSTERICGHSATATKAIQHNDRWWFSVLYPRELTDCGMCASCFSEPLKVSVGKSGSVCGCGDSCIERFSFDKIHTAQSRKSHCVVALFVIPILVCLNLGVFLHSAVIILKEAS